MIEAGRTVYFMGAGATKADFPAAPLGDELLHAILVGDHADQPLRTLLSGMFEESALLKSARPDRRPRLDDVFTLVDAYLAGRAPSPGGFPHEELVAMRGSLIAAIGKAIAAALPAPSGPISDRFAQLAMAATSVVISTNYDIVMDNALYRGHNFNYGVPVRASIEPVGARPAGDFRAEDAHHFAPIYMHDLVGYGKTPLLKLHGSLNWLYCPRCDELDITPQEKGALFPAVRPEYGRCCRQDCTARYESVLVGPSLEQRYEHRILRDTWAQAERELLVAQFLVIIGYSLPEADYLIRAMLARTFGKRSQDVTVVTTRNEEASRDNEMFEIRYRRLFPRCTIRPEGFAGYLDKQTAPPAA
jgi:hypothetical protein